MCGAEAPPRTSVYLIALLMVASVGQAVQSADADAGTVTWSEPRVLADFSTGIGSPFLAVTDFGSLLAYKQGFEVRYAPIDPVTGELGEASVLFTHGQLHDIDGLVDPDGRISIIVTTVGGLAMVLFQSLDGGVTWTSNEIPAVHTHDNRFATLIRDGDGRLGLVYSGGDAFWGSLGMQWSSDNGATWTPRITIRDSLSLDSDIWIDADGDVHVVWAERNSVEGHRIQIASSTDGGIEWSAPRTIESEMLFDHPAVYAGPNGEVWLFYLSEAENGKGSPTELRYRTSTDQGSSWSAPVRFTTDSEWDRMPQIVDVEGAPTLTWLKSDHSTTWKVMESTLAVQPDAPVNLSAQAGPGRGEISLQWHAPAADGGSPIDTYHVYRSDTAGGAFTWIASPTDTSHVDGGLGDGKTYHYRVKAENSIGLSPSSNEATTATFDLPAGPVALAADPGPGRGDITVDWLAPLDDGGAPITAYRLYRDGGLVAETYDTSVIDTALPDGHAVSYTISALNVVGEGPASGPVSATTFDRPSAPQALDARRGEAFGDIVLEWFPPQDDGGDPVDTYEVFTSEDGQSFHKIAETFATSYNDTVPGDRETYWYMVRAVNLVGRGPLSNIAEVTSPGSPSPPLNPQIEDRLMPTEIGISWDRPVDDGGRSIQGYTIVAENLRTGDTITATAPPDARHGVVSVAVPTDAYAVTVAASNVFGLGEASDEVCGHGGPWHQALTGLQPPGCQSIMPFRT